MKRIAIDGRFIGIGQSMTRYTLEILKGILELDKENEYTLIVRPIGIKVLAEYGFIGKYENPKSESKNPKQAQKIKNFENPKFGIVSNFDIRYSNLYIDYIDVPHYSLGEQTKFLSYLNKQKFDLVHFIQFNHPVLYRGKFVVTVHDLTMVGYLHRANPIKKAAFLKVMKSAVKDSVKVITISNTAKEEIIEYYHPDPAKIEVIYNGINHEQFKVGIRNKEERIRDFKKKYKIAGDYLFYSGMWKKHKNIIRMLKAFELVKSEKLKVKGEADELKLVIGGKEDKDEPEVTAEINRINKSLNSLFGIPNSIVITGFLEEDELPVAYAGALGYVIPSLSEGFGLPPLEAMACGTPVIASNVSCMPEVLGDAALYFDPYDIDDMAEKMGEIVEGENLRKRLVEKGLKQAAKYSWDKAAKEVLGVYKELI